MPNEVSTNVRLPQNIFKALKIKAAQEGKSMKQLIIEGVSVILGSQASSPKKSSAKDLLLKFSGSAPSKVTDGSIHHDKYIYGK